MENDGEDADDDIKNDADCQIVFEDSRIFKTLENDGEDADDDIKNDGDYQIVLWPKPEGATPLTAH